MIEAPNAVLSLLGSRQQFVSRLVTLTETWRFAGNIQYSWLLKDWLYQSQLSDWPQHTTLRDYHTIGFLLLVPRLHEFVQGVSLKSSHICILIIWFILPKLYKWRWEIHNGGTQEKLLWNLGVEGGFAKIKTYMMATNTFCSVEYAENVA